MYEKYWTLIFRIYRIILDKLQNNPLESCKSASNNITYFKELICYKGITDETNFVFVLSRCVYYCRMRPRASTNRPLIQAGEKTRP